MDPEFKSFDGPIPLFPLPNVVLYPHMVLPLHIFEPRYRKMLADTMADRSLIGMVKLEPELPPDEAGDPAIRSIGCVGKVIDHTPLEEGRANIQVVGIRKFEILSEVNRKPYRTARVRWIEDRNEQAEGDLASELIARNWALLARLAEIRDEPATGQDALEPDMPFNGLVHAQVLASRLLPDTLQDLLELNDVLLRAERLSAILQERVDIRKQRELWRTFFPENPSLN